MKKKQYWTNEEETLVIEYITEQDYTKRNVSYNKLQPKLLIMIESILKRYYGGQLKGQDIQALVNECECFVVNNVFAKFNQDSGRSYSYIGTCIKHYYYDKFFPKNKFIPRFIDIDQKNAEGEPLIQIVDESSTESDFDIERLRRAFVAKIKAIETTPDNKRILHTVLKALTKGDVEMNRYALTYLILKSSGLKVRELQYRMYRLNLINCIYSSKEIDFYEKLLTGYLSKNLKHKNYITSAINEDTVKKATKQTRKRKHNVIETIPANNG